MKNDKSVIVVMRFSLKDIQPADKEKKTKKAHSPNFRVEGYANAEMAFFVPFQCCDNIY